jgi:hypothetical protein
MQMLTENKSRVGVDSINAQYNRVPYLFSYEMAIKTKNIEDMNQILEQILPYFNPSMNVIVQDNKDLNADTSINIKMQDIAPENMFEGSFEDEQVIETTLMFDLEGYLYMPTSTAKIIKAVNINYYDLGLDDKPLIDSQRIVP